MTNVEFTAEEINNAAADLSELVVDGEFEWDRFLKSFAQEAFSPREELAHRIQCAIDGVDPGEPLNRGSDGWKVWS